MGESERQVPTLGLRIFSPPLYQLSYVPLAPPQRCFVPDPGRMA